MAAASSVPEATPLDILGVKLQELSQTMLEIGITTFDYKTDLKTGEEISGPVLRGKINEMIMRLQELEGMKGSIDTTVPYDIICAVEGDANPDIFTGKLLQVLVDKNQKTNGRIQAIKEFQGLIEKQMEEDFPDVLKEFRDEIEMTSVALEAPASAAKESTPMEIVID